MRTDGQMDGQTDRQIGGVSISPIPGLRRKVARKFSNVSSSYSVKTKLDAIVSEGAWTDGWTDDGGVTISPVSGLRALYFCYFHILRLKHQSFRYNV